MTKYYRLTVSCFFFFNDTATTEIYTLSLHDALPISSPAPSAASAEPQAPQEKVGDEDRGAHQDADEHGVADVEVADVGHLVRDDPLQLVPVQLLEEPRGDGDGGVIRIPPRGEGVGGRVLDDVDLRHREAGGYGHLLDDVEEDGGVVVGDLPGPRCGQDHSIASVIGRDAGDGPHDEGEPEPEERSGRIPDPGPPDDVAEDGHEGEEGGYEEQALAPVYGYALAEGTLVGALAHLSSRRRPSRTPARDPRPRRTRAR